MDGPQFTSGKGCNNRKLTDEDRAEIVRLYTTPLPDGTWMGVTAIAKQFGVAHNCIQYRLKRAGVTFRDPREAHVGKRCKPITNVPLTLAPACACGCGNVTEWNQRKNRWNHYVKGHYTQQGVQNPCYLHGRAHEPYTDDWPEVSRQIRRRDGFQCQRCLGRGKRLHVHHIDTDKLNNDPANLVTFCAMCHSTVHAEIRRGGGA